MQSTHCTLPLTMPIPTVIAIGFVMSVNATNNIIVAGQILTVTAASEHIVLALLDHGCAVLGIVVM